MLISFSVGNFRSFNQVQHFSMKAGRYSRLENHLILFNGNRYLKCGALFGANASGKSNLIKAVQFAKSIVFEGVSSSVLANSYFRLLDDAKFKPGFFEFRIESNNVIYEYGFEISYLENRIIAEWLYKLRGEKRTCIFKRELKKDTITDLVIKEKINRQRFDIYTHDVASTKTILAEFAEHKLNDIEDFKAFFDVYDWFGRLMIIFPDSYFRGIAQFYINDLKKNSYEEMLAFFDSGIKGISEDKKPIEKTLDFLPDDVRKKVISDITNELENDEEKTADLSIDDKRISISKNEDGLLVAHELLMNHGNDNELFKLEDESDGTRRLFDLIPIYSKAQEECVFLVDELDRSFHSKLTQEFIKKYYADNAMNRSQLVFTTHDLHLMSLEQFRQDEIWFVEKDEEQSSKLFSLQKYNARFDKDIAKGYLRADFGAVPSIGV